MEILAKQPLDSSRLVSATYVHDAAHPLEYILTVTFKDGGIYSYYGVPKDVAMGLFSAQSPGGYLAQYIKNAYNYAKVDEEPVGDTKEPTEKTGYTDLGPVPKVDAAIAAAKVEAEKLPQSRAKALVLTKLDEAQLWLLRCS